jgi:hypothetical protein
MRQEEDTQAVDRRVEVAVDRHLTEEDHPQGEDFQQDMQPVVAAAVMEN